mgnify:FL=1
MRDVKRFPTTTGLSWLEMSSFKDHLFKGHEKIGKEYDYVIVGGGYGGYGGGYSAPAPSAPVPPPAYAAPAGGDQFAELDDDDGELPF